MATTEYHRFSYSRGTGADLAPGARRLRSHQLAQAASARCRPVWIGAFRERLGHK